LSPTEFHSLIARDITRWSDAVKKAHINAD